MIRSVEEEGELIMKSILTVTLGFENCSPWLVQPVAFTQQNYLSRLFKMQNPGSILRKSDSARLGRVHFS